MMINPDFVNPILTISNALNGYNIPHTLNVIWDGLQIRFPWNQGDIVCHSGAYGHQVSKVESMGFPWDDGDVSCLTVGDAIEDVVALWHKVEG